MESSRKRLRPRIKKEADKATDAAKPAGGAHPNQVVIHLNAYGGIYPNWQRYYADLWGNDAIENAAGGDELI